MRQNILASQNGFVHICGHRGHNVGAPENTIAAFRECHRLGGTSLEIDTVVSSDAEIVVLHDLLVDRTTDGTGAAHDMTTAQIAALDAGSKFNAKFAGERVPTLRQTIDLANELDMIVEVEVKEELNLAGYTSRLRQLLAETGGADRAVMISFDHAQLKQLKADIPGIRTAGIVHEKFPDPVAVARMSNLDELCIDLSVFDPDGARRLHEAGIAIRCHAYSPKAFDRARRAGLQWETDLATWLQAGLIDTLSGDDVGWLSAYVDKAGVRRRATAA